MTEQRLGTDFASKSGMTSTRRLYVTSLMSANNCSHMYRLKLAGFEPLPMDVGAKAGILFERAAQLYLPVSELSASEAVAAANEDNLPEQIVSFITYALESLPPELLHAKQVDFSVFAERELNDIVLAGFIDIVADGEIFELKYTQKHMSEPSKAHIFQLQHYMYLMDKDYATIVYAYNTKLPGVVSYRVRRWSEAKYFSLIKALANRYDEDAPTGLIHDWQCNYCSFRHVCEYYNEETYFTLWYSAQARP